MARNEVHISKWPVCVSGLWDGIQIVHERKFRRPLGAININLDRFSSSIVLRYAHVFSLLFARSPCIAAITNRWRMVMVSAGAFWLVMAAILF